MEVTNQLREIASGDTAPPSNRRLIECPQSWLHRHGRSDIAKVIDLTGIPAKNARRGLISLADEANFDPTVFCNLKGLVKGLIAAD